MARLPRKARVGVDRCGPVAGKSSPRAKPVGGRARPLIAHSKAKLGMRNGPLDPFDSRVDWGASIVGVCPLAHVLVAKAFGAKETTIVNIEGNFLLNLS